MATNLAIDDKLIEEARLIGKHATKKGVVTEALLEYIQRRKQIEILDLFHSVDCNPESCIPDHGGPKAFMVTVWEQLPLSLVEA